MTLPLRNDDELISVEERVALIDAATMLVTGDVAMGNDGLVDAAAEFLCRYFAACQAQDGYPDAVRDEEDD